MMNSNRFTGAKRRGAKPAVRRSAARAFTLIEVLTVISIIALLATIGAGMSGIASWKSKEANLVSERDKLVTAIESYYADFNQYPPDNAKKDNTYTSAITPLYYELIGTVSSNRGSVYRTMDRQPTKTTAEIEAAFGLGGFLNAAEAPDKPKTYLPNLKERQRREVLLSSGSNIELLAAPVDWPAKLSAQAPLAGRLAASAPASQMRINPWQYVSSHPTNNTSGFDLWVEVVYRNERKLIANWKE